MPRWCLAAVVPLFALHVASVAAQTPRERAAADAGTIAGTVTAADSGRPLRGARVWIEGGTPAQVTRVTSTDSAGRFVFTALPAGEYTLTAGRLPFLEVVYGQRSPGSGRSGTPIRLRPNERLNNVSLPLPRGGVLTGVVSDENGDPAFGVGVRALPIVRTLGMRTTTAGRVSTTDDRGMYRISGLPPGEYLITTLPSSGWDGVSASLTIREDAFGRAQIDGADRRLISAPPPAVDAYVPVYYPGSSPLSQASIVSLRVAEERAGIDLQLQRQPVTVVRGMVTLNGGPPPKGTDVQIIEVAGGLVAPTPRSVRTNADGSFELTAVVPGTYSIVATALGPAKDPPDFADTVVAMRSGQTKADVEREINAQLIDQGAAMPHWATTQIVAAGQPMTIAMSLQPGIDISGTVRVDSGGAADLSSIRVALIDANPLAPRPAHSLRPARVDEHGRFTIRGVVPGAYRIEPTGAGGLTALSSVFRGRDSLDFPLIVDAEVDIIGGVITLTARSTELIGVVQDAAGTPTGDYTIVVFSEDPQHWTPGSRRIQAVRPATDGRYRVANLPPGAYRLAAITDVETGVWFDPAFLRPLTSVAIAVTLGDGERRTQDIRVK